MHSMLSAWLAGYPEHTWSQALPFIYLHVEIKSMRPCFTVQKIRLRDLLLPEEIYSSLETENLEHALMGGKKISPK